MSRNFVTLGSIDHVNVLEHFFHRRTPRARDVCSLPFKSKKTIFDIPDVLDRFKKSMLFPKRIPKSFLVKFSPLMRNECWLIEFRFALSLLESEMKNYAFSLRFYLIFMSLFTIFSRRMKINLFMELFDAFPVVAALLKAIKLFFFGNVNFLQFSLIHDWRQKSQSVHIELPNVA